VNGNANVAVFSTAGVSAVGFNSVSAGTPIISSPTTLTLAASTEVIISGAPMRLASFTTTQRNALAANNGDVIYNTTDNKFQGYQNGTWVNLS
jgi:hypothetical protein